VISQGTRPGEAFYGQIDHMLMDKLKVIGGFQANKIGDLSFNVVPRGGLIWKPAAHYTVKALYSQAFRAPSINETKMDYIPPPAIGGPSLIGNPDLKPEHVSTTDLELLYGSKRFEAEINYFYSQQKDDIVESSVTSSGEYVNLGQATFQGGELEGKYYLHKDFLLIGAGSYQGNHDGSGNTNIAPVPNLAAKAGVSYQSSANGVTASLFDVHQGPMSGYEQATNPKPTAYDLLNLHFDYDLSRLLHLPEGSMSLTAQGNDLLDKAVWLPDWKDVPGDTIFFIRGRTILAGMVVSF
jgi:outer membrane receptor protein involved in Fe transport